MLSKTLFLSVAIPLLLVPEIFTRRCNQNYVKDANILLGTKESFHYYNWRTYQSLEGRVSFVWIEKQDVRHLCKFYMPDTIMEVIFLDIKLEYIEPGFFQSNSLEQVYIQYNNLKRIHKGVFGNTGIKSLVLADNNIEHIEGKAFENMTKLEAIALEYNKIKTIDTTWFDGARVLYEVLLSHNKLEELPEGSTKNMVESLQKNFFKMYGCVDFDNNNIKFIHPDAFGNLRNFGIVSLSNNQVMELPEEVFGRFKFLLSLYMNTNKFICFNNDTISSFHGVKRLFLAQNKMNRDCVERLKLYFDEKSDLVYF